MRHALFFSFFLSLSSFANDTHFTTVFLDDEGVIYVGVKRGENPGESEVISFPFDSGERVNIPLPKEIIHRDVIGLIPEKKKLFVLTNGNSEPGDGPMLHVYDRAADKWTQVGKVICPTFTKVTMHSSKMVFSCEVGKSKRGKTKVEPRAIALKQNKIYRGGVWRFPEFMLRYKGRTALLEGPAPVWDTLRLRSDDGNQRTISAEDLMKLPLPGAELKVQEPTPPPAPSETDSTEPAKE